MTNNKESDSLLHAPRYEPYGQNLPFLQQQQNHSTTIQYFQICYWIVIVMQLFSIVIFLLGQTIAVFDYDLTVRMGLQEDSDEIGPAMVQMNRCFGAASSVLFIPLLLSSLLGLVWHQLKPSLICTAASAGISSYWSLVGMFVFVFESRSETWQYFVPVSSYLFCAFYFCYGVGVLTFLYVYLDKILHDFK
jgi:hypothetical protein